MKSHTVIFSLFGISYRNRRSWWLEILVICDRPLFEFGHSWNFHDDSPGEFYVNAFFGLTDAVHLWLWRHRVTHVAHSAPRP